MGRYYSGDIEGKFMFAVQNSDSANRFGVDGYEPNYIVYNFQEEDLEGVELEIKNIEEELGDKLTVINKFFEERTGYNDEELAKVGITKDELSDYADLDLGKKIRDCIKETGQCSFEAEL